VLATGCFTDASFAREGNRYTFEYRADSSIYLQMYLDNYAPNLRDDVIKRFGDSVKTSRRVLELVKPGKSLLYTIVAELEAIRKYPQMHMGRVEPEIARTFISAFSNGIITARPELNYAPLINPRRLARTEAGWEDNAGCVSREMRQKGLDDHSIVDLMIELEIEAWRILLEREPDERFDTL
jgi:hypothetical protein